MAPQPAAPVDAGPQNQTWAADEVQSRGRRAPQPPEEYDESLYDDETDYAEGGSSKSWILWLAVILALALVVVMGMFLYRTGAFDPLLAGSTPTVTVTSPSTSVPPTIPLTPPPDTSGGSAGGYRDPSGQVTGTAGVHTDDLMVGDCIYNFTGLGSPIDIVQVLPCSSPHEAEVYATQTQVANDTNAIMQFCQDQFQTYIGTPITSTSLKVTYIHAVASQPLTNVQCVVYDPGQLVTISYKGSKK